MVNKRKNKRVNKRTKRKNNPKTKGKKNPRAKGLSTRVYRISDGRYSVSITRR